MLASFRFKFEILGSSQAIAVCNLQTFEVVATVDFRNEPKLMRADFKSRSGTLGSSQAIAVCNL